MAINLNDQMLSHSFKNKLCQVESVGELATLIKSVQCFGVQDSFIGAIALPSSVVGYVGVSEDGEKMVIDLEKEVVKDVCGSADPVIAVYLPRSQIPHV